MQNDTTNIHIHDNSLSLFVPGTSMKRGGVKLDLWGPNLPALLISLLCRGSLQHYSGCTTFSRPAMFVYSSFVLVVFMGHFAF
jgi:hypothetical protein